MATKLNGKNAPDFTLTDSSGQTLRLSDYRGRNVVLLFNRSIY